VSNDYCTDRRGGDGVVGIATTLRAGRTGFRIPRRRIFSRLQNVQTDPGVHPPKFSVYRGTFWGGGVKRLHNDDNHLPPSSVESKNEGSYTLTPPLCLHGMYGEKVSI
jgi:hypothetical protein